MIFGLGAVLFSCFWIQDKPYSYSALAASLVLVYRRSAGRMRGGCGSKGLRVLDLSRGFNHSRD